MTTLPIRNLMNRSPLRRGFLLVTLALACFALSPTARAVNPAPDGGYPGQNTAEGDDALFSLTSGGDNTAVGFSALFNNTTGYFNTAVGDQALYNDATGSSNTASGFLSLFSNTEGNENTATGTNALEFNTSGSHDTANGAFALLNNTFGNDNTANGYQALYSNTSGNDNAANGSQALYSNTGGQDNTANGFAALFSNTTGNFNTANGYQSLYNNTADENTASGYQSLYSNTTGVSNTAAGRDALHYNTTGNANTAAGLNALVSNGSGNFNTATGVNALFNNTTGNSNIALGYQAGAKLTTGDNNIDIGNVGVAAESATIRIGTQGTQTATFIAGINGIAVSGVAVKINSSGQLGVPPSSERFKDAIKPMDKASEAILALKPVTFRYKRQIDPDGIPQFGLVAEQVEKVNPDLVARDAKGKVYTVRYEAVNAMLLNEFLKEHRTVQELKSTAAKQEATIAHQQKQIEALSAGLQKVSAQIEVTKRAAQTVLNNQ